jgi:hypothetical protein
MTTQPISPLRQRMIEDMNARKRGRHCQRSHLHSCARFAAFLQRSPETATADDIRRFQLHLAESGISICNRNRIMTGVKFLLKVTLRRHDLAAEIYHLKEPIKLPLIMSPGEAQRLVIMADKIQVKVMLALGYGCGLRAGEIVRLKVGDIDSVQSERLSFAINAHSTSSASCSPRAARTGLSCCRPVCWPCRGSGGWSGRRTKMPAWRRGTAGCFQAACRGGRSRRGSSTGFSTKRPGRQASASG